MEQLETACDSGDSDTAQELTKKGDHTVMSTFTETTRPNDLGKVDADDQETKENGDPAKIWRSSQAVEDVNVTATPPGSPESKVRRRKGKLESNTSELGNNLVGSTDNTGMPLYNTSEMEDESPEGIKKREKKQRVEDVLSSKPVDLEVLRELAISAWGLVDDGLRKEAWPLLMAVDHMDLEVTKPSLEVIKAHRDYQQVVLDVKRTLKRFPPGIDDERRLILMDQLTVLIIRVLMKHPELYYYQGYHDVAITFLLVTGEDMGYHLVEQLSITHLVDFMKPTMEKTNFYLTYLYPILHRANPKLYQCLVDSGVDTVFCLPWLITWFAHTLSDYRHVVRLYDFFLASPYLMPMYIATAIVLQKEKDLLAEEREVSSQFAILSKDPDNLPFEDILVKARELHDKYPPDQLTKEVNEFIEKRKEKEEMEKERILAARKKADSYKLKNQRLVDRIFNYVYIPLVPTQRRRLIKLAVFTATVFLARSIYKQYYMSTIEYSSVLD